MTTKEYIRGVKDNRWPPFDRHVWQRGYHDHIIRNIHPSSFTSAPSP